MRVALVLRSGGVYGPQHVRALAVQLSLWSPYCVTLVCLTDNAIPGVDCLPLRHGWPGWWSKMELFRPDIKGDLLYLDLDTLICGSLEGVFGLAKQDRPAILRDFYRDGVRRAEGLQSAMMFIPEHERRQVWGGFIKNPECAMYQCGSGGDQRFLERYWLNPGTLRIQDALPDQVVSYKVHCKNGIPKDARVVCAHGKPKFWDLPQFQHLY